MSVNISEGATGVVDTADLMVQVSKRLVLPPTLERYKNISVFAKKKSNGSSVLGILLTEDKKNEQENNIEDVEELRFAGSIKLWNTLTQDSVNSMLAWGETLVVLSSATNDVKNSSLNFKNLIIWFTEVGNMTTLDDLVQTPFRGAFIDNEKKGKLLYALSHFLDKDLSFTAHITHPSFKGITSIETAKNLDDAGFSYFFRSHELCWLRGFWLGRQQARSIYADRSVIYDVKNEFVHFLREGKDFSEDTLSLLEVRLLSVLKLNQFVKKVLNVMIPRQKSSDKVRGIIRGITVNFETSNEVRTVIIELGDLV